MNLQEKHFDYELSRKAFNSRLLRIAKDRKLRMIQLEEKIYFYFLFIIPVLVVLFVLQQIWKRRTQKKFGDLNLLKRLTPTKSIFKSTLKLVLFLVALALLILGLVNPKIGTKTETIKREGVDIVFALDVSKSMLAEDVKPNRLEKGKQIINEIINQLGNDRVGIVGYAGSAYPVLPMTTDYSIAKMYLQNMNTFMISSQGTALNDAIRLSETYFDAIDTSKLIILVSDGEDHGADSQAGSELAKEKGIKIITMGVGTENGGPIPIKNDSGSLTKLNTQILEDIAKSTNGGYIAGNNTKEALDRLKNAMDNIEKTEFETEQIAEYQTQYQWFLAFAFLLILADIFFFEKKTAWVQKLNLFNKK